MEDTEMTAAASPVPDQVMTNVVEYTSEFISKELTKCILANDHFGIERLISIGLVTSNDCRAIKCPTTTHGQQSMASPYAIAMELRSDPKVLEAMITFLIEWEFDPNPPNVANGLYDEDVPLQLMLLLYWRGHEWARDAFNKLLVLGADPNVEFRTATDQRQIGLTTRIAMCPFDPVNTILSASNACILANLLISGGRIESTVETNEFLKVSVSNKTANWVAVLLCNFNPTLRVMSPNTLDTDHCALFREYAPLIVKSMGTLRILTRNSTGINANLFRMIQSCSDQASLSDRFSTSSILLSNHRSIPLYRDRPPKPKKEVPPPPQ